MKFSQLCLHVTVVVDSKAENKIKTEGVTHDQTSLEIGMEIEESQRASDAVWDEKMVQECDDHRDNDLNESEGEIYSFKSTKEENLKP